jgi:nucleotide-binding universal stress UspA family protein
MPFIATVVVAVDFSEHSRQALRVALALAERQNARLVAVTAIDLLLVEAAAVAYDDDRLRTETETSLRLFVAAECRDRYAGVPRDVVVRTGRADREILACVTEQGADMVVVGTHGLGGVRKLFFGSTAEKVLRSSRVPVLAVPFDANRPSVCEFTSVLAAVELDETAESMAAEAARIATALGVPLALLHVVRPLQIGWRWAEARDAAMPARVRDARKHLEAVARTIVGTTPTVVVSVGEPEEQVAAAAVQQAGALVVVGLGEGELFRRPGSVAYRILSMSTAPVLAVPVMPVGQPAAATTSSMAGILA